MMAQTKKCALCGDELNEANRSPEHIIPQAIGGRLTVDSFICSKCNHRTGNEWDADLVTQIQALTVLLGTKRQKGHPPPVLVQNQQGDTVKLHHDGHMTIPGRPIVTETYDEAAKAGTVKITADSVERAETIAEERRKKYEKFG